MKKILKSNDGNLYLNVTENAMNLFELIDLHILWEKAGVVYKIPVCHKHELDYALSKEDTYVCIEIGSMNEISHTLISNSVKWKKSDILTHNGYIYIKFNSLFD